MGSRGRRYCDFFYRSIIANAGQEELMKIISGLQFPD